jgi:hypothetical protein
MNPELSKEQQAELRGRLQELIRKYGLAEILHKLCFECADRGEPYECEVGRLGRIKTKYRYPEFVNLFHAPPRGRRAG